MVGNGTQTLNGEDTLPNNTMTLFPGDSGLWDLRNPAWQLLGVSFFPPLLPLGEGRLELGAGCLADATSLLSSSSVICQPRGHTSTFHRHVWSLALGGLWMLTQPHRILPAWSPENHFCTLTHCLRPTFRLRGEPETAWVIHI